MAKELLTMVAAVVLGTLISAYLVNNVRVVRRVTGSL